MIQRSLLITGALLAVATAAAAQADSTPKRIPRDTAARATATVDTLPAYLPTFPLAIAPGPLPRGSRYSFSVDSLVFSNIATLADLLNHVPGVYVARGGYFGQPEVVNYGGRGAQGLEVYWDGVPYRPLGRDSVFLDAARIPLAPLERVDVIVLPATLRVYLVSGRHRSSVPETEIRILTGDFSIAGYRGRFSKRWRSGAGVTIGADWNSIAGDNNRTSTTQFSSVDLWIKAEYVPTPRGGVSYQILSTALDRSALPGVVPAFQNQRRDNLLRFFLAGRDDGLGPRIDGAILSTQASHDVAVSDRSVGLGQLTASQTWTRANLALTTRFGGFRRRSEIEASAGWIPLRPLTLSGDGRRTTYADGRSGSRAHVAAGLALPLGFSVHGDAAWGKDLQAPALFTDRIQQTTDLSGSIRLDSRPVTLDVGVARRGPFAPLAYEAGLVGSDSLNALGPTPASTYLRVHGSLRPLPGLQLSGWYFDPKSGGDFEPPHHGRAAIAFYSKFWRVYRSGVFALRAEYAVESWTRGLGGVHQDTLAGPAQLVLPGGTFQEFNLQMRIVGVTAFWVIRNNNFFRGTYVPGLGYPRRAQFFGARWLFSN